MELTPSGFNFLKSFESCSLKAYQDVGGIWTIGWGSTQGVKEGDLISQMGADVLFEIELKVLTKQVNFLLKRIATHNQFDALISFAYNVGIGAFKHSTLLTKFNQGDMLGAAQEFLRWNKVAGEEVPGLTRRRKAERDLFLLDTV